MMKTAHTWVWGRMPMRMASLTQNGAQGKELDARRQECQEGEGPRSFEKNEKEGTGHTFWKAWIHSGSSFSSLL